MRNLIWKARHCMGLYMQSYFTR